MGHNISVKVPGWLQARLEAVARKRRTGKSAVVRDALEAYFARDDGLPRVSCYDLSRHLAGCLRGPRDLATNPKYMRGFGR